MFGTMEFAGKGGWTVHPAPRCGLRGRLASGPRGEKAPQRPVPGRLRQGRSAVCSIWALGLGPGVRLDTPGQLWPGGPAQARAGVHELASASAGSEGPVAWLELHW